MTQEPEAHVMPVIGGVAAAKQPSEQADLLGVVRSLREEITTLTAALAGLGAEEKEAQQQLESLRYALNLTRGEVARRQRSNSELHAPATPSSSSARLSVAIDSEPTASLGPQQLRGELLNAKRDSAELVYEVERLGRELKSLRTSTTTGYVPRREATSPRPATVAVATGKNSPLLTSSPHLKSSPHLTSSPSPQLRAARLIGDVDGIAGVSETYAACRVGVSATGCLALFPYHSPQPVVLLGLRDAGVDEQHAWQRLSALDARALRAQLRGFTANVGGRTGWIIGLGEGVSAARLLAGESEGGLLDVSGTE